MYNIDIIKLIYLFDAILFIPTRHIHHKKQNRLYKILLVYRAQLCTKKREREF